MMQVEATKEHAWLQKFVGEWSYEGRAEMGCDGGGPMEFSGTESVRAIGEYWIQGESTGEVPGGDAATMIVTVGFDPKRGRYVGSWFGSMMPVQYVYEGWVEKDGKTLVLETEGTIPMEPDRVRTFRDITEFKSPDHRQFRAEMRNDDGSWTRMMQMDFRRVR